ncbi:MAG: hypothetical protein VB143_05845 [Burkholderia sp.]
MRRIQAELDAQEARASADARTREAQRGERQRASSSKRKAAEADADRADTDAVPDMAPAQISRSLRDLYRCLASALHPYREPDADERARKTALMQRLNRAYDKQDLLQLLELERDLGAAEADRLAGAGDELLQHYNGILKAQLASLDRELHRVEADSGMATGSARTPCCRPTRRCARSATISPACVARWLSWSVTCSP